MTRRIVLAVAWTLFVLGNMLGWLLLSAEGAHLDEKISACTHNGLTRLAREGVVPMDAETGMGRTYDELLRECEREITGSEPAEQEEENYKTMGP